MSAQHHSIRPLHRAPATTKTPRQRLGGRDKRGLPPLDGCAAYRAVGQLCSAGAADGNVAAGEEDRIDFSRHAHGADGRFRPPSPRNIDADAAVGGSSGRSLVKSRSTKLRRASAQSRWRQTRGVWGVRAPPRFHVDGAADADVVVCVLALGVSIQTRLADPSGASMICRIGGSIGAGVGAAGVGGHAVMGGRRHGELVGRGCPPGGSGVDGVANGGGVLGVGGGRGLRKEQSRVAA